MPIPNHRTKVLGISCTATELAEFKEQIRAQGWRNPSIAGREILQALFRGDLVPRRDGVFPSLVPDDGGKS